MEQIINLSINSKLDPSNLSRNTAFVYKTNLYITDDNGSIAYFGCDMQHTDNAGEIRSQHQEYKLAGGKMHYTLIWMPDSLEFPLDSIQVLQWNNISIRIDMEHGVDLK